MNEGCFIALFTEKILLHFIYIYLFVAVGLDVVSFFIGVEFKYAMPISLIIDSMLLYGFMAKKAFFPILFKILLGHKIFMIILMILSLNNKSLYFSGSILLYISERGVFGFYGIELLILSTVIFLIFYIIAMLVYMILSETVKDVFVN